MGEPNNYLTRAEADKRYVVKDSDEHQSLLRRQEALEKEMLEVKKSSWRTERYLVGGLTDDGQARVVGLSEKIDSLIKKQARDPRVWALFAALLIDIAIRLLGLHV